MRHHISDTANVLLDRYWGRLGGRVWPGLPIVGRVWSMLETVVR